MFMDFSEFENVFQYLKKIVWADDREMGTALFWDTVQQEIRNSLQIIVGFILSLMLSSNEVSEIIYPEVVLAVCGRQATPLKETMSSENSTFVWVSSYYLVENSRHSSHDFVRWITPFLTNFNMTLFFFTSRTQATFYQGLVKNPNIRYITKYARAWDIPCVNQLRDVYRRQVIISNSTLVHEDVLAIWNSKVCLAKEISDLFPDSIVLWIDAGSLREPRYRRMPFPNPDRLTEVFPTGTTNGEMVFAMFQKRSNVRQSPMQLVEFAWAIGGFFAGDHPAIERFYREYWNIHNKFASEGRYVGMEQYVFSTYMLYVGNSWVQPNYKARGCDTWFSTFSFYGDVKKCRWANGGTVLDSVSNYIRS